MMQSLVSVIIPTFNRRKYVVGAVESVMSQTYSAMEVIVVDDGSTDGTGDVLRSMFGTDQRFRYIWQKNSERAVARNRGIEASAGEYIAFLDSDDQWQCEKVARQVRVLADSAGVDLVSCGLRFIDERGGRGSEFIRGRVEGLTCGDVFEELVYQNVIGTPSAVIVRKRSLERTGLFSVNPVLTSIEDWEMWLRLAYKGKVEFVAEPLTLYRVRSDAVQGYASLEARKFESLIRAVEGFVDPTDRCMVRRQAERRYRDVILEEEHRKRHFKRWCVWGRAALFFGPRFPLNSMKLVYWRWLGRKAMNRGKVFPARGS